MANETMRDKAINWLGEDCKPTGAQFSAIMNAIFFKEEGELITQAEALSNGDVVLTFFNGNTLTIEKFRAESVRTSDIKDLPEVLDRYVLKRKGKQLSTNDFSDAFKQKLESLFNYQKPASEPIAYIEGLQKALEGKADVDSLDSYLKRDVAELSQDEVQAWRELLGSFNGEIPLVSDQEQITLTPDQPHLSYAGTFAHPVVTLATRDKPSDRHVHHIIHNKSDQALTIVTQGGLLIDGKAEKRLAPHRGAFISPERPPDGTLAGFSSFLGSESEPWLRLDGSNVTPALEAYLKSLIQTGFTLEDSVIHGFSHPAIPQDSTQTLMLLGEGLYLPLDAPNVSFACCDADGQPLSAAQLDVLKYTPEDSGEALSLILKVGSFSEDKVKASVRLQIGGKLLKGTAELCLYKPHAWAPIPQKSWVLYTELDRAVYDLEVTDDGIAYKGGQSADFQVAATPPDLEMASQGNCQLSFSLEATDISSGPFVVCVGLVPKEGYVPNACYLDLVFASALALDSEQLFVSPLYRSQIQSERTAFDRSAGALQFQLSKLGPKLFVEVSNASGSSHCFERCLDRDPGTLMPKVSFCGPAVLSKLSTLIF